MGGLRALCCSKGDKNDPEDHDSPNRPVQKVPEKDTQNGQNALDMTQGKPEEKPKGNPPPRNLWKEAYDGLHPSRQKYVPASGVPATDAIQGVIDSTTQKYEEWKKGGLRVHRKGKENINIRDSSERIIGLAMNAKDVISTVVSFDPTGHASSAWTIVSFGMSVVQNRLDRRDAIFHSSEYLTENLAWFALIDAKYRNQGVGSDQNVDQALLRVYSAILEFTSEVKKAQEENEGVRTWKSIFPFTDQPLSTLKTTIEEQKGVADKWVGLATNLGDRERAREHLVKTDATLESARNVESKILTAEEETQLKWMSDVPYSERQNLLQDKRTGDTGIWLLDSQEYNDWMLTPGDLLWLPGITGCGKSVLCSTVISDLGQVCDLDPYKYLAYWYFQFGKGMMKSVYALTRSLIRQLSRPPLASSVVNLWKKHHLQGSQPDSRTILSVLDDVLSNIPDQGHVYLVFDALDECPGNTDSESERGSLLSLLMDLLKRHKDKIHILATSRPEQDIRKELEKFPRVDLEARLAEDLEKFVTAAISRNPLQRYSEEVKILIFDALLSSRERRFRWAELQIQAFEKRHKRLKEDEEDVKEALKKVPQSLEETYRRVLDSIEPDDVPLARDILMITCLSPATLDINTVAEMVNLGFSDDVVNICTTSLVSIFDDKVQVAHFSVQEFLIVSEEGGQHHKCQFSATNGHKFLATKTVNCLLEQTKDLTEANARKRPFFLYAAKYWCTHATALEDIDRLDPVFQGKIDRLFIEPNVYFNWVRIADSDRHINDQWSKMPQDCEPPIHRASRMGLLQTVDELLNRGANPDVHAPGGEYGSALQAASHGGREKIVQMLLDRGVNVNAQGGRYSSALQVASMEGNEKIVQILLDRHADINAQGGQYGSALQAASYADHEKTVQILLDRGADINAQGGRYGSALQVASMRGNETIVQILLDRGADSNAQGGRFGSALQIASYADHEKIVQILLDRGADINAQGGRYGSALQIASLHGNEKIVQILLDRRADVNAQGRFGSALQIASYGGHEKIMQMLLGRGADPI